MPTISIIVPVYKVEKYIHRCVDSIMNQTITDFELILVDDGSPDNCGAICDEYAEKDSRVRVIHQQNRGLSCARNAGIDAAKGEYICFVDSDDLVLPDYCRVLLEQLRRENCDICACGVLRFLDGEEPTIEEKLLTVRTLTSIEYMMLQLEKKTEFGVWNKLFRRDLFDKLRFMSDKRNEDVIFSADLLQLNCRIAITTQTLYCYRQREDGIVSVQTKQGDPDILFAGEYLLRAVEAICPKLTNMALRYAVEYPWLFVDPIYVKMKFNDNQEFLTAIQAFLRKNIREYQERKIFSGIQTRRMALFSISKFLYGINAYARLLRVYLYRLLGKDAYADGHGI